MGVFPQVCSLTEVFESLFKRLHYVLVYVHGFGTDHTEYHDTPVYHDKSYKAPVHAYDHHLNSYEHHGSPYYTSPAPYYKPQASGYGYGHINEYGEAKHGYGYQDGYGYHGSTAAHYGGYGKAAHSPYYAAVPYGGKYAAPSYHGPLYGHHAQARTGFASGFGYGYIA